MNRQEAIQIIKNNWPNGRHMLSEALEFLIPELKSEDERVKNEIIAFVEQSIHRGGGTPIPQEQENRWIAWIEKQGKHKHTCRNCHTFKDLHQNCPYSPIYQCTDLTEAHKRLDDETNCEFWIEKQGEPIDKGEISDGYHTFNELYYYRMLYNAAFFNLLPKEWVHKSKRHHTGEECFGGGWFIVMAQLPTGQISNHYELKYWDLFNIQEKEIADEWDGHSPQEAAKRLIDFLLGRQGEQKPAEWIQWTGKNLKEVIDFTGKSPSFDEWFKSWDEYEAYVHSHGDILKLFCADESHYEVPVGAWIVKTPDGYNIPSRFRFVPKSTEKSEEHEKPLLEKFRQAVYDCAWEKVTCKKEGETKEEYANRWAEHFLLIVRDWADDYIDYTLQQKLRKIYDSGKKMQLKKTTLFGVKRIKECAKKLLIGLKRDVFLLHLKVKIQQEKVLIGSNPSNTDKNRRKQCVR